MQVKYKAILQQKYIQTTNSMMQRIFPFQWSIRHHMIVGIQKPNLKQTKSRAKSPKPQCYAVVKIKHETVENLTMSHRILPLELRNKNWT